MPDCYIFQADMYCVACTKAIKARLRKEGRRPADPSDQSSYDSDEWPKGPFSDEESDSPEHCGSGPNCLDPTEIGGERYGQFFENPLTTEGIRYVRDEASNGPVKRFWINFYGIRRRNPDGGRTESFKTPVGTLRAIVRRQTAWTGDSPRQSLLGVNVRYVPAGERVPADSNRWRLVVFVPALANESRGKCRIRAVALALTRIHNRPLDLDCPIGILADWSDDNEYHDIANRLRK